jgi:hypothetical protein
MSMAPRFPKLYCIACLEGPSATTTGIFLGGADDATQIQKVGGQLGGGG